MKWSSPPYRRSYSLDVSESGRVLCFGGCAGSDDAKDSVFGDLWLFDPETRLWDYAVRVGRWPEPRYGHSSVFVPKTAPETLGGCLIFYGERKKREKENKILFLLSLSLSSFACVF